MCRTPWDTGAKINLGEYILECALPIEMSDGRMVSEKIPDRKADQNGPNQQIEENTENAHRHYFKFSAHIKLSSVRRARSANLWDRSDLLKRGFVVNGGRIPKLTFMG